MVLETSGPAATDKVEKRSLALNGMLAAPRIECSAAIDRMDRESERDPGICQFRQHIARTTPVFKALEITVEAAPDILVPFTDDNWPARTREHDCRGQTG